MIHDWPTDTAEVLLASMLVNTIGRQNGFKELEGDLDVEHLNNAIKSCAHGPNATPKLLEKITPEIGEIRQLVQQLFDDLDVEDIYQRHSYVKQDKDIWLLVAHMQKNQIFRWGQDRVSGHEVPDLLHRGLFQLAGRQGGHMKHLMRHKLRLRTRHVVNDADAHAAVSDTEVALAREADEELGHAVDTHRTTTSASNHISAETDVFDIPESELVELNIL